MYWLSTPTTWSLSTDFLFYFFIIHAKVFIPVFLRIFFLSCLLCSFLWLLTHSHLATWKLFISTRVYCSFVFPKWHCVYQWLQIHYLTFFLAHVIVHSVLKNKKVRGHVEAGRAVGVRDLVDLFFCCFILLNRSAISNTLGLEQVSFLLRASFSWHVKWRG